MADIDVSKIQAQIQSFKAENPEITKGLSDDKVVSIMLEQGKISKEIASKASIMLNSKDLTPSLQKGNTIWENNSESLTCGDEISFSTKEKPPLENSQPQAEDATPTSDIFSVEGNKPPQERYTTKEATENTTISQRTPEEKKIAKRFNIDGSAYNTAKKCQIAIDKFNELPSKRPEHDIAIKLIEERLKTFPPEEVEKVKDPKWRAKMSMSRKLNNMTFNALNERHQEASLEFDRTLKQMGMWDYLGQGIKGLWGETDFEEAAKRLDESRERLSELGKKRYSLTNEEFGSEVEYIMDAYKYNHELVEKIANDHPEYLELTSAKQTTDSLTEMSKQEYSNENFKNIQTALGGEKYLTQIFPEYSTLSQEEKFKKLQLLSSEASKTAQAQLKELLKDRDYEEVTKSHEKDYKRFLAMIQANDVTRDMEEFKNDVAFAGGAVRIGVTIGATIALTVATGGTGAVALGAISAGTTAAVDISNRATNGISNAKDLYNAESIRDITIDSAVAGLSAGAGGKAADLIWKTGMKTGGKFFATAASDSVIGIVASGVGMELKGQNFTDMTTGEILQNIAFAAGGSAFTVATSKVRYTSLKGDVNFTTNKAYAVGAWLRKSGILKDEIPIGKEYDKTFDINKEIQINGGKDLTPAQMEILNKVANSKARVSTKQLDDLINLKSMAEVDARIHDFSVFKPQKGKPPIIEENGIVQFNTNNPAEIIKYLKTIDIKKYSIGSCKILKSPSKGEKPVPLTNLQVETLNKVINKFNEKYYKPNFEQLETFLAMDDKTRINAIIDNDVLSLVDLKPKEMTLFMEMYTAKNADGSSKYGKIYPSIIELRELAGQELFDKWYNFKDKNGNIIIDDSKAKKIFKETDIKTRKRLISQFEQGIEFFSQNKHFYNHYKIPELILNSSDEEFKTAITVFKKINDILPQNSNREKVLEELWGSDYFDIIIENAEKYNKLFEIAEQTGDNINIEIFRMSQVSNAISLYETGDIDGARFIINTGLSNSLCYGEGLQSAWKRCLRKENNLSIEDFKLFIEQRQTTKTIKIFETNPKALALHKKITEIIGTEQSCQSSTQNFFEAYNNNELSSKELTVLNDLLEQLKNTEDKSELTNNFYAVINKLHEEGLLENYSENIKYQIADVIKYANIYNNPRFDILRTEIKGFKPTDLLHGSWQYITDTEVKQLQQIGEFSPSIVRTIFDNNYTQKDFPFILSAMEQKLSEDLIKKGLEFNCNTTDINDLIYLSQKAPNLLEMSSELGLGTNKPLILSLIKEYVENGLTSKYPENTLKMGLYCEVPMSRLHLIQELMDTVPEIKNDDAKNLLYCVMDPAIAKNKSLREIRTIANSMQINYESLLKRYPQLKNHSIIKNIEDTGGIKAATARIYESKINTIRPIKPRLGVKPASRVQGDMYRALKTENLEKAFKNFDFEKYSTGIPLSYPRAKFVEDLNEILKNYSDTDKKIIAKQFGFEFTPLGHIDQFPRPVDSFAPNLTPEQRAICEKLNPLMEKFVYENKVVIPEHPQMQKLLNSIIDMFPEFISVIGKQQHGTHAYSIDMHTLKALKECIEHPNYKNLAQKDKTILHLATLMHDLGKMEAVEDDGHYLQSALYSRNLLEKLSLNREMQERVFNLVENHHWRGELMTGKLDEKTVAARFRSPKDWELAQIFADADLKGVSEAFYNAKMATMQWDKITKVEEAITQLHKTGIPIFSSKMLNHPIFPSKTPEGVPYINIAHATDEQIKKIFGTNATRDNLTLNVHVCGDKADNFNSLRTLSALGNEGHLSTTLISSKNTRTYCYQTRGILLEARPSNVTEAYYCNTTSGTAKDGGAMVRMLNSEGDTKLYASNFMQDKLDLTPSEYAELYKDIADKKFQHIKDIEINGKKISGDAIRKAITEFQENLIMREPDIHNEVCVFNPELKALFALCDSIDEVSEQMKTFAKQHNLPIIIHPNINNR